MSHNGMTTRHYLVVVGSITDFFSFSDDTLNFDLPSPYDFSC